MADVFISYSTEDKNFGQELYNALSQQESLDIWMDWRKIEPTTEWWEAIKEGIRESHNFVLIISSNSMSSPIVHLEINHALANNKRIIPILYRRVDSFESAYKKMFDRVMDKDREFDRVLLKLENVNLIETAPNNKRYLESLQWISFEENKDFTQQLGILVAALNTDIDYLKLQTRLLIRADEWDAHGREGSYLLRGADLDNAETWLSDSFSKNLRPTELHLDYINASKAAQQRQSRNWLVLAVAALVITMGLLFVSLFFFQDSRRNLEESQLRGTQVVQQLDISESLRLASEANLILNDSNGNNELATLLAIRAVDIAYTSQADTALIKALDSLAVLREFRNHAGAVQSVAVSPDGRYILTGSTDMIARLFDKETGQEVQRFVGHTAPITSAIFSPDGQYILTSSGETEEVENPDNTIWLWNAATGEEIRRFEGHQGPISSLAFSPEGTLFASGSGGGAMRDGVMIVNAGDNTVRLWNVETGSLFAQFPHDEDVHAVAYSPDGRYLLVGVGDPIWGEDHSAKLWDIEKSEIIQTFEGHTNIIQAVAFSSDGQSVFTGSDDRTIIMWDANTGAIQRRFEGHTSSITSLAVAMEKDYLLSGSFDDTARLWDINTGQELYRYTNHSDGVLSVAIDQGEDHISFLTGSSDQTAHLWSIQPPTTWLIREQNPIYSTSFSPDGQHIVITGNNVLARIINIETRQEVAALQHEVANIPDAAFSPDGKYVVTVNSDNRININRENGNRPTRVNPYDVAVLWDWASGQRIRLYPRHQNMLGEVDFSSNGQYFATAGSEKIARIWDVETGELKTELEGEVSIISDIQFSPDNRYVATSSARENEVRLWDIETGTEIRQFTGHTAGIQSLDFSPDGTQLLTGSNDKTARLWDVETGTEIHQFTGYLSNVSAVTFSPDGQLIATGTSEGIIYLWQLSQKVDPIRIFTSHQGNVKKLDFSPDGQRLLSIGDDNVLRLIPVTIPEMIDYACTRVFRTLTDDEYERFLIDDKEVICSKFSGDENS